MSNAKSSGGIGFTGALTLVFVTLKLTDVIDWSWWWVLSPLWISVGVFLIILLIVIFAGLMESKTDRALRRLRRNKWGTND